MHGDGFHVDFWLVLLQVKLFTESCALQQIFAFFFFDLYLESAEEQLLSILVEQHIIEEVKKEPIQAIAFAGDFYGLLRLNFLDVHLRVLDG